MTDMSTTTRPMAGVIFSGIDPTTDVVSGGGGCDRADSPDSGQGGYFTQSSESDTSSTRGSQSPVETSHHIYKISRSSSSQETSVASKTDNRKTKSTLLSHKDVTSARDRSRSQDKNTGRPLTNTPINKVNSNNKAKLPPRPPRTSSSLPPPVPKKQRDSRLDTNRQQQRSSSLIKREVLPPERKSIHGRTLPLQIQSPSIVQALRAAGNISETKARSNLNVRHQNSHQQAANVKLSSVKTSNNNVPLNKSKRNNNDQNALNGPEKPPVKFPTRVTQTPRDASNRSKEPIKASGSKLTKNSINGAVSTSHVKRSPSNENPQKHKLATESLASRAKRTTEDKVKKIYNTLKSPKQDRKLNYSDRRKNLQRGEMLINTNNNPSEFPKQPVQSLIKLYDKSKVKTYKYGENKLIQGNNYNNNNNQSSKPNSSTRAISAPATTAKLNQKSSDVVGKTRPDDTRFGQNHGKIQAGSRTSSSSSQESSPKFTKETKTSSTKPNSIDEFLQSAKRTRQKYQNMLNNNDPEKKIENDNLEVKTDPSESDLQTGCFTDVSYAGYFAKTPTETDQKLNDVSICGNISNLDEDQNKLCKQPSDYQEASATVAAIENNNEEHLDVFNNKDVNDLVKKMPTPSPRLKKKQRREQILQEHKQLGKMVLAIAKNNFEPDNSSNDNHQEFPDSYPSPNTCRKSQSPFTETVQKVTVVCDENMVNMSTGDNMGQLEREIESLTEKCRELEDAREKAVNDLEATQLMSVEQIEKLCTLERKQDLLEAENKETRQKLLISETEFNKLTNQYLALEKNKEALEEENEEMAKMILQKDESIMKYKCELRSIDSSSSVKELDDKIEFLQQNIQKLVEEKDELQRRMDTQMSDHYADIENIRDAYQKEKENLDKQLVSLKERVAVTNEFNEKLQVEKKQLDEKLIKIEQLDYEEVIDKLKLELKQSKALLRDAQANKMNDNGNEKIIKQLKTQLEETELEKSASLRQKKTLEMDILDLQEKLYEVEEDKKVMGNKFEDAIKENTLLNSQIKDNEEELENILTKYKTSIATLTAHQNSLQNQATIIAELENENINLFDKIEALQKRLVDTDTACDEKVYDNDKYELKITELEHKLKLELTSKTRLESQIEKMKEKIFESENEQASAQKGIEIQEELNRKLNTQVKDLKEDIVTLQIKEMDICEKKNILEKKLEISEAETVTVRSQLEFANRRIEDLQLALNCDTESENSSIPYSDSYQDDLDVFLMNHRKRMAEQKEEERKIRESLLKDSKTESDC